jgi:chitinase
MGGAYTHDKAGATLDLDRRNARLQQQGGKIAVSFGGLLNNELALKCADDAKLKAAYAAVLDRYHIDTIDLDLENDELADNVSSARRAKVIAELQSERRAQGKNLAVWLTLPVAPQGLTQQGTDAVTFMLAGGVDLAGVNVMTMDYGQSRSNGQSMLDASKSALTQAHRQLGILYQRHNVQLSSATVWSKIGATPMIGKNDDADEVFTLDDAKGLNAFARSNGAGRMSMWSANRDRECGSNYTDLKTVSDSCSGIKQDNQAFTALLSAGFDGNLSQHAAIVTTVDSVPAEDQKDDPATSPYQIWNESGTYLAGTKVVWHHNVYQAKWWTQGELPDNPVLQSWETPWELIGPVLPGEKPVPQATLPAGTYPDWSGTAIYDAAQRVLFKGVPYQAKWWNEGQSPAAASSNPDGSPWTPLTQTQVNEVEAQIKKDN